MAALHRRHDAGRFVAWFGLVPVRPRLHLRLREVFETILFYAASVDARQWRDDPCRGRVGNRSAKLDRLGDAAFSRPADHRILSLPRHLIAILTVVLAGKGVGALQEAG